jgi:hypothetical protein
MNARDFRSRDGCRNSRTTKAKAPSIARGFEILEHRLPDALMICRVRRLSSAFDCPPKAKAPRFTRSLQWVLNDARHSNAISRDKHVNKDLQNSSELRG